MSIRGSKHPSIRGGDHRLSSSIICGSAGFQLPFRSGAYQLQLRLLALLCTLALPLAAPATADELQCLSPHESAAMALYPQLQQQAL
ncbi:MAG: hypothetical protein ACK56E_14405, partial [Planctomyces sp.]